MERMARIAPNRKWFGNTRVVGQKELDKFRANWFKTLAPPVMSFLRLNDFTGKTIIPFCTHGGGGFGQIANDIAKECPKSKILPGIAVTGTVTSEEVTNWLKMIEYEL